MLRNSTIQPYELNQIVTGLNLSLSKLVHSQLILVTGKDADANLACYDKEDTGVWRLNTPIGIMAGYVGKNGVHAIKQEGDGCTPAGLFSLGYAFGCNEKPETKMAYRKVTTHSFWVDDPGSQHYNTWVESEANADWASAEHLSDYPREYAYAVVVEYNTAARVPGKGSAVFLHCGSKPTAGCVAVPQAALLQILKWLDPNRTPGIMIATI